MASTSRRFVDVAPFTDRFQKHGRRDLRLLDLPEERVEISDPLLEGKTARIGTEESTELRWKRGGFVRLVLVRIKYEASKPAIVESTAASDDIFSGTGS